MLWMRTWQLGISRGVSITGEAEAVVEAPALPDFGGVPQCEDEHSIHVREGFANVYTETARIFNPIHSDKAYALAAGLPDIILHGTATMALAVSRLVNEYLDGDSTRVKRLGGRMTGMVLMPTDLTLKVHHHGEGMLAFSVLNPDGGAAFSGGFLCYDD